MVRIAPDSHVTLHYRLAAMIGSVEHEVVSTLGGHPATLQLGAGQLAAPLESRLVGLCEGDEASFELAPDEAFGERNDALLQAMSRAAFDASAGGDRDFQPGDVVEFNDPAGGRVVGVLRQSDDRRVLVDFNHPLAGRPVRFSVRVIGVL